MFLYDTWINAFQVPPLSSLNGIHKDDVYTLELKHLFYVHRVFVNIDDHPVSVNQNS